MPYLLGPVKPHVKVAAEDIGARFGVGTIHGFGLRDNVSDHPLGLALDFMVYQDKRKGDQVAAWCQANASAYGVKNVIWFQKIWTVERQSEGWRSMDDRGSATANHFDHVHVSFNAQPGTGTPTEQNVGNSKGTGCPFVLGIFAVAVSTMSYAVAQILGV